MSALLRMRENSLKSIRVASADRVCAVTNRIVLLGMFVQVGVDTDIAIWRRPFKGLKPPSFLSRNDEIVHEDKGTNGIG
ncbi:hypothetical protein B7W85_16110 [Allorhizobium ampelinum]|nr:hypothetical protein BBL07_04470 [Agrobacterium vitis]OVE93725.1 hypothetical protein B7W85_16110 [Allorhizobium ampelinum]